MTDTELYRQLLGLTAPWEVGAVTIDPQCRRVEVRVVAAEGTEWHCPECQQRCPGYDAREERAWRHLDSCAFETWLLARVPRVACPTHGVKTVAVPWAAPHSRFTLAFAGFARCVLRATKVQAQAAALLRLTPAEVNYLMDKVVQAADQRREATPAAAAAPLPHLTLDEKQFGRGQSYVTVLGNAQQGCVHDVAPSRNRADVRALLETSLKPAQRASVRTVTLDLWQGFLDACRQVLPQAALIYDRFHAAQELNKAIDLTRRAEHRRLREGVPPQPGCQHGKSPLSGTRFWWLRAAATLPEAQRVQLERWQAEGLETAQVWACKEAFRAFYTQESPAAGRRFLAEWYAQARAVGNPHLTAVVAQFEKHEDKLLAYLEHQRTNALAESLNSQIEALEAAARGFRRFLGFRRAILFFLGEQTPCPQTFP